MTEQKTRAKVGLLELAKQLRRREVTDPGARLHPARPAAPGQEATGGGAEMVPLRRRDGTLDIGLVLRTARSTGLGGLGFTVTVAPISVTVSALLKVMIVSAP